MSNQQVERPGLERHRARSLHLVKCLHTVAWGFFAGCVIAIPVLALGGDFRGALLAGSTVMLEVGILAVNGWRCPLTPIAARYTEDRSDNFDIYLPLWVARHNKTIFGLLYVAGAIFALLRWRATR